MKSEVYATLLFSKFDAKKLRKVAVLKLKLSKYELHGDF